MRPRQPPLLQSAAAHVNTPSPLKITSPRSVAPPAERPHTCKGLPPFLPTGLAEVDTFIKSHGGVEFLAFCCLRLHVACLPVQTCVSVPPFVDDTIAAIHTYGSNIATAPALDAHGSPREKLKWCCREKQVGCFARDGAEAGDKNDEEAASNASSIASVRGDD